jgi:hypothetical protein
MSDNDLPSSTVASRVGSRRRARRMRRRPWPTPDRSGDRQLGVDRPVRDPRRCGEALDAGTPLEILPAELQLNVGDTIRNENQDDRGHTVGPCFVGANETLSQRFSTPGDFEGVCTVHPSGQFVLVVDE